MQRICEIAGGSSRLQSVRLIREDASNPGHFRELTRTELVKYCEQCGFTVVESKIENLFQFGNSAGRLFARIADWLPQTFRHDMTVIAQKRIG